MQHACMCYCVWLASQRAARRPLSGLSCTRSSHPSRATTTGGHSAKVRNGNRLCICFVFRRPVKQFSGVFMLLYGHKWPIPALLLPSPPSLLSQCLCRVCRTIDRTINRTPHRQLVPLPLRRRHAHRHPTVRFHFSSKFDLSITFQVSLSTKFHFQLLSCT